jgi:hypothetical protein
MVALGGRDAGEAGGACLNVPLDLTVKVEFRVRARDDAGNLSSWAPSDAVLPAVVESRAEVPARGWSTVKDDGASGGSVERATKRGAKVSLVFRGHGVAIVAPTGPGYGVVRIRERGITVATVNLGRLPKSDARVIWSRSGWHRESLEPVTADGTWTDAFLVRAEAARASGRGGRSHRRSVNRLTPSRPRRTGAGRPEGSCTHQQVNRADPPADQRAFPRRGPL